MKSKIEITVNNNFLSSVNSTMPCIRYVYIEREIINTSLCITTYTYLYYIKI